SGKDEHFQHPLPRLLRRGRPSAANAPAAEPGTPLPDRGGDPDSVLGLLRRLHARGAQGPARRACPTHRSAPRRPAALSAAAAVTPAVPRPPGAAGGALHPDAAPPPGGR